jgi:hypothetical protein
MTNFNFLLLNPSKGSIANTYVSTNHISNNLGIYISIVFLLFVIYIILRVRKSFKEENK